MATTTLEHVAKIEGHAGLKLKINNGLLESLELEIFEGARFFENILKNKKYDELPLITARICGVCSPAHTLASIQAIEAAFGIRPNRGVKLLRELLAIGGLIQSHVMHLYFLVLPDYVGFDNALHMRSEKKREIEHALKLKRLGNRIVETVGGRDVHPLTAYVGGFSRYPSIRRVVFAPRGIEVCKSGCPGDIHTVRRSVISRFRARVGLLGNTRKKSDRR